MEFTGQYLTYEEYNDLGGTLTETPFNLLEFEVRKKIDEKTQGRLKEASVIPQEVKMCVFALMNSLQNSSNFSTSNKNVVSETIDGYSVSYGSLQEIISSKNVEINDTITYYLTGIIVNNQHLLYLGVK